MFLHKVGGRKRGHSRLVEQSLSAQPAERGEALNGDRSISDWSPFHFIIRRRRRGWLATARVQRGPSEAARCASTASQPESLCPTLVRPRPEGSLREVRKRAAVSPRSILHQPAAICSTYASPPVIPSSAPVSFPPSGTPRRSPARGRRPGTSGRIPCTARRRT